MAINQGSGRRETDKERRGGRNKTRTRGSSRSLPMSGIGSRVRSIVNHAAKAKKGEKKKKKERKEIVRARNAFFVGAVWRRVYVNHNNNDRHPDPLSAPYISYGVSTYC